MKKLSMLLMVIFSVVFINSEVSAADRAPQYLGSWSYECNEAPYPYHKGTMNIFEKDGNTNVDITFDNGQSVNAVNVKVIEGKLHFDIWVEGNMVKTILEKSGKKVTGNVDSPEGAMSLTLKENETKK